MSKWMSRPGIDKPLTTNLIAECWDEGYTVTLDARTVREAIADHEAKGWVRSKGKKSITRTADNRYRDGKVVYGETFFRIKFRRPDTKGESVLVFRFRFNPGTFAQAIDAR